MDATDELSGIGEHSPSYSKLSTRVEAKAAADAEARLAIHEIATAGAVRASQALRDLKGKVSGELYERVGGASRTPR
nr:hypothetical protein [Corynebacterium cyclohexanicum]